MVSYLFLIKFKKCLAIGNHCADIMSSQSPLLQRSFFHFSLVPNFFYRCAPGYRGDPFSPGDYCRRTNGGGGGSQGLVVLAMIQIGFKQV